MAKIVYFSGRDDEIPGTLWREEGELPPCVDQLRTGEFTCNCGKHHVSAWITTDPVDSQERMARTVTYIGENESHAPLIRVSYQGEEFAVTSKGEKDVCGIIPLEGRIVKMGNTLEEKVEFQIAADEKELRLALIPPYYWVLVNEETGQGYVADTLFPNCMVSIDLPLPGHSS